MRIFLLLISICFWSIGNSQVEFKDFSDDILESNNAYNTSALGVGDLNGDHRDDIVTFNINNRLEVYFQGADGKFFKKESSIRRDDKWSIDIGDIDHDNRQEILLYTITEILIIKLDQEGNLYIDQIVDLDFYTPQGTNLLDINNDGILELFICNDISDSNIFSADSNGVYAENHEYIFITDPVSDNSGNYGSIWTDIDNDNDLDLYIVKCSVHAPTDTTDARRINQMFINDNGNLIENKNMNLSDSDQSWSVDAADIDNDGDIDIFYTNHNGPHTLMINEGDTFTKSDFLFDASVSYQSVLEDFDNNGFVDIIISAGSTSEIYYNFGNENFVKKKIRFLGSNMSNVTVGDFNTDGFLDIYGSSTGTGSLSDRININQGNDNNFLYFQLEGTISNTNAIGAKVRVYTPDGIQMREVKSGISYGITKSQKLHFGLGSNTVIDSVEIIWPTGIKNTFDVENVNTTYMITETSCISEINMDVPVIYSCPDEKVVLEVMGADDVKWNFGMDTTHMVVEESGYQFAIVERDGCKSIENQVEVIYETGGSDILGSVSIIEKCEDEAVILKGQFQGSYLWSNGENTSEILAEAEGEYTVELIDLCGEAFTSSVELKNANTKVIAPEKVIIESDSLLVIQVSGSAVRWYQDVTSEPFFTGNVYEHYYTEDTTTFFIQRNEIKYSDIAEVGLNVSTAVGTTNETVSSGLYFDVTKDIVIESIKINAFKLGKRRILIYDNDGNELFSKDIFPTVGVNTVDIYLELGVGNGYYITTDRDVNIESFGHNAPLLGVNKTVDYPYEYEVGIRIDYSDNGRSFYPYFFNWNVKSLVYDCSSDFHQFQVIKDMGTSADEVYSNFKVYPNPSNGIIKIEIDGEIVDLQVYNVQGQLVDFTYISGGIKVENIPGMYYVKMIEKGGGIYTRSIMIK